MPAACRSDDTADRVRTVRDARYKLIRNYQPERPYLQRVVYAEITNPAYNRTRQLFAEGKLNAGQSKFMASSRPPEEFYDLQSDPCELHNRITDPARAASVGRLRKHLDQWIADTRDQGAIPEDPADIADELTKLHDAEMKTRARLGLGPHDLLLKVPQGPEPH